MECAIFVGIMLGSLGSSYVYKFLATHTMFGIATIITLVATLHVMFFVEESIQHGEADRRIGKLVKINPKIRCG